jgi:hypothetical protein
MSGPGKIDRCARIHGMEINQIKRFIKDLEERTDSLRRYL